MMLEANAKFVLIYVGSERARNAKTAGATLAEAGKINESLMYLGQCLQMQSDCQDGTKVRGLASNCCNHADYSRIDDRPIPPMQID